jgi:hypothetical protein
MNKKNYDSQQCQYIQEKLWVNNGSLKYVKYIQENLWQSTMAVHLRESGFCHKSFDSQICSMPTEKGSYMWCGQAFHFYSRAEKRPEIKHVKYEMYLAET